MTDLILRPYAHFRQQVATGVNGGGAASGVSTTPLNTTVFNNIAGLSRSGNDITIPAGDYWLEAYLCGFDTNQHEALWYNITDDLTMRGSSNYFAASRDCQWGAPVVGRFTAPSGADTVYRLQQYALTENATDGRGQAISDGEDEVHAELWIYEIAP